MVVERSRRVAVNFSEAEAGRGTAEARARDKPPRALSRTTAKWSRKSCEAMHTSLTTAWGDANAGSVAPRPPIREEHPGVVLRRQLSRREDARVGRASVTTRTVTLDALRAATEPVKEEAMQAILKVGVCVREWRDGARSEG
jgi:hypothetical protein